MKAKFVKGMMVGSMIGMSAAAVVVSNMSRGTKRKIKRYTNVVRGSASDMFDGYMKKMR
ncbi:hypothetical protein [Oceanirhabdus sp. W0125-5]|uniref:hypothetical protein n=1 Tax=Oceanirhabdus sp. W0125-5 TaxID=2999116 RepID=UPI0022F334C5|nr:hypothetical protein [Oceanirhabdus sp. W0125-5]WBW98690.1 hypothetical protein OW730_08005 [Oceanirhabdus sp. W0125-5]